MEEEERATACQNEFPIHPSRHHHSFFFRIEAARRLRLLPASTTTTAVSRSFCLSKVEKATFVMVCIGDRGEKKESGLNATSSRALESYDYWLSYQHREEKTSHESRHVPTILLPSVPAGSSQHSKPSCTSCAMYYTAAFFNLVVQLCYALFRCSFVCRVFSPLFHLLLLFESR